METLSLSGRLPATLWDEREKCLSLPPQLVTAYTNALADYGLLEMARGPRPDPAPVGGPSQELTDLHFAHAFGGSLARAQLALLDPHQEVSDTASTLLRFLSGGQLSLTDVPCGAGAGALALLSSIAHLRAERVLPRLPLRVHVVGGEISAPARVYAESLLSVLVPFLAEQAIQLSFETQHWDVLDTMSNTALIERIVVSKANLPQTLLLICNFNSFLERAGKKDEARPQLAELLRYCSGRTNAAVWIEPKMNSATNGLFPWLRTQIAKWSRFVKPISTADDPESTECKFSLPLSNGSTAIARLSVFPLDLAQSQNA
jgi:hypothetical protein